MYAGYWNWTLTNECEIGMPAQVRKSKKGINST